MDKMDDHRLKTTLSDRHLSRRAFIVGTLAAGFALSVQPVSAQTITTDTNGLTAGEVKIQLPTATSPPIARCPPGGPSRRSWSCKRSSAFTNTSRTSAGAAPSSAISRWRRSSMRGKGDVSKLEDFKQVIASVVSKVPGSQVMSDLDATVAWAEAYRQGRHGEARPSPGFAGRRRSGSMPPTTRGSRREWPGTGR